MDKNINFDFSKNLVSPASSIVKYSYEIKEGSLSKVHKITVGKELGVFQNKNVWDKILEFFSKISSYTTDVYHRRTYQKFEEFLKTNKGKISLKIIEQANPLLGIFDLNSVDLNELDRKKIQPHEEAFYEKEAEISKEKLQFLRTQAHSHDLKKIAEQNRRFPLIKLAIRDIIDNYDRWNSAISSKEIEKIQEKIEKQHQNLNTLSAVLQELRNDKTENLFIRMASINNKDLIQSLQGESLLDPIFLKNYLLETLKQIEQEKPKEERPSISEGAIAGQAKLMEVTSKAVPFLQSTDALKKQEGSINDVFPLKGPEKEVFAYFKEGYKGEKATGVMEKLAWNVALLLGVEKNFVPTREISFGNKDLRREGGIQPAVTGIRLRDYLASGIKKDIRQNDLIEASLATLIFGMFDAHGQNIIIDEKGVFKFFDNTRTLPNSNGVVIRENGLVPTYRSELMLLPGNLRSFTEEERQFIHQYIMKVKPKIKAVEKYLNSNQMAAKLAALPIGWIDPKAMLESLEERVKLMEQAAADRKINNMQEFIFAVNPDFKFFAALKSLKDYIQSLSLNEKKQNALVDVVGSEIKDLFTFACQHGVDPILVQEWSKEFSFNVLLEKVLDEYRKNRYNYEISLIESSEKLMEEYARVGKIDFKDINRNDINLIFYKMIKEGFDSRTLQKIPENKVSEQLYGPGSYIVIEDESNPPRLSLHYLNGLGIKKKNDLDYLSNPGFIKIGEHSLSPQQIHQTFYEIYDRSRDLNIEYTSLQKFLGLTPLITFLNEKQAEDLLSKYEEGAYIIRETNGSLWISFVDQENKISHLPLVREKGSNIIFVKDHPKTKFRNFEAFFKKNPQFTFAVL